MCFFFVSLFCSVSVGGYFSFVYFFYFVCQDYLPLFFASILRAIISIYMYILKYLPVLIL